MIIEEGKNCYILIHNGEEYGTYDTKSEAQEDWDNEIYPMILAKERKRTNDRIYNITQ